MEHVFSAQGHVAPIAGDDDISEYLSEPFPDEEPDVEERLREEC
jgi:hypothetical protein